MSDLKRTKVDKFLIENAITFEELEKNKDNLMFLKEKIINMETIFSKLSKITLNRRKQELFFNGVMLTFELEDGIYNVYSDDDKYIGIGVIKDKLLKRDVII